MNNQYVAAGYFDGKLRVYSQLSWKEIYTFDHSFMNKDETYALTEDNSPGDMNIYVEQESARDGSVYEIGQKPYKLPALMAH